MEAREGVNCKGAKQHAGQPKHCCMSAFHDHWVLQELENLASAVFLFVKDQNGTWICTGSWSAICPASSCQTYSAQFRFLQNVNRRLRLKLALGLLIRVISAIKYLYVILGKIYPILASVSYPSGLALVAFSSCIFYLVWDCSNYCLTNLLGVNIYSKVVPFFFFFIKFLKNPIHFTLSSNLVAY